jgi:AbiU2
MSKSRALSEAEYWNQIQLLSIEIEDAVTIFHTYEEMNRLASEDRKILDLLNEDALFWKVQAYSLQTSLFIILGRIFDTSSGALSIHKVVNATICHPEFFSRESLARRKSTSGPPPNWLRTYLASVWVPQDSGALRFLKKGLVPYQKTFEAVYRPIRHLIYAHRITTGSPAQMALFGKTSSEQVGKILDFLHELIDAMQNLYLNGIQPDLGSRSYREHNERIRDCVVSVLRKTQRGSEKSVSE